MAGIKTAFFMFLPRRKLPVLKDKAFARDLDPELAGIIRRAMAADRTARYPTAAEFADDLERVLGRLVDEPVKAFKPGEEPLGARVRRRIRRHTGAIAALLVLFGLATLGTFSCTVERHIAFQNEKERLQTEIQEIQRNSDQKVRAEIHRSDASIEHER